MDKTTRILYEISDIRNGEIIGRITGAELRAAAGVSKHSPVFNQALVEKFNANKASIGEPERIRQIIT